MQIGEQERFEEELRSVLSDRWYWQIEDMIVSEIEEPETEDI
jgi:hypothetical protein